MATSSSPSLCTIDGYGSIRTSESNIVLAQPPYTAHMYAVSLQVFKSPEDELGRGSGGTVVYKGSLEGRAVAVKCIPGHLGAKFVEREVAILRKVESDRHPNIIRYYFLKCEGDMSYLVLERCLASLADIVGHPDKFSEITGTLKAKKALKQMTKGVAYLHSKGIVHRDIKPQNILVSRATEGINGITHRMLVSDFGLCKTLEAGRSSYEPTAHGAGTTGWKAPEIILGSEENPTRLTKKVDVFALGCVDAYVLKHGEHPFGKRYERDVNVLRGARRLDGLDTFNGEGILAENMISKMLSPEARDRPYLHTCLLHPYFWKYSKCLDFLQEVSDWFETKRYNKPLLSKLEQDASQVVGGDWKARLDECLLMNLGTRCYDGHSVQDLLRAIRNKKNHYNELPADVKRIIGSIPGDFLLYFTRRFPKLVLHVYGVVATLDEHKTTFRTYFEHSKETPLINP